MVSENSEGYADRPRSGSIEKLNQKDVPLKASIESLLKFEPEGGNDAGRPSGDDGNNDPFSSGPQDKHQNPEEHYLRKHEEAQNSHAVGMRAEELKKAQQENKLRTDFFEIAISMAIFVLLLANFGILVYLALAGAEAAPQVLVAWLVSVVAEVIVILHIIAKYLFPPANR